PAAARGLTQNLEGFHRDRVSTYKRISKNLWVARHPWNDSENYEIIGRKDLPELIGVPRHLLDPDAPEPEEGRLEKPDRQAAAEQATARRDERKQRKEERRQTREEEKADRREELAAQQQEARAEKREGLLEDVDDWGTAVQEHLSFLASEFPSL